MDFLTRGDAINVFGRRVPISFLAVAATLLAAYMVLRARNKGSNIVSAGTAPAQSSAVANPYSGFADPATSQALGLMAPASVSSTYDPNAAAIAQLQQSQQDILDQLAQTTPTTPTTTPSTSTSPGSSSGPTYGPTSGGTYSLIQGGYQAVAADSAAGLPIYYQPVPGGPYVQIPTQDIYPGSGYNQTFVFTPGGATPGGPAPTPASVGPAAPLVSNGGLQPTWLGRGAIHGGAGKVVAFGWTHKGPVRGRVRLSAFRHPGNPLAPAA